MRGRVQESLAAQAKPVRTSGTQRKILEVAEALFARRGFAGVGVREVAESAGLSKSSLFHHFRSKVQLYEAVLARVLARIEERLAPTLAAGSDLVERLDRWIDALIDGLTEQPATSRLLLRALFEDDDFPPEPSPEGQAAQDTLRRIIQGLVGILSEGMERGVFRSASPPHTVQTLIGATVYHFASGDFGEDLIGGPLISADAVRRRKDEVKGLLYRGLAVEPVTAFEEGSR